jgi:DNA invertase Pin-like site-specific DNA recombinase
MTPQIMDTAVIYGRKSEEDKTRQICSIEDQLKEMATLQERVGIPVIATFTESKSGKTSGVRKEFYCMLKLIEEGKANTILCWKADRLSRNGTDGGRLIELVDRGVIRKIITPNGEFDRNNSYMLWIEFMGSTKYSKDLSDNIKRRLKYKAESGVFPNQAPLGYQNTPWKIKGTREIEPDPERFELCRKWWELMLSGCHTVESSREVVTGMGLRGKNGKKISLSSGYKMFRYIFYTGIFDFNEIRYEGIHKPMVTISEFTKVQRLLDSKGNHGRSDTPLPFQGMLKCTCGATITGEKHKRGSKWFWYYRCTKKLGPCTQPYLNADNFDPQVREYIASLKLAPHFGEWIKKVLKRRNHQEFEFSKKNRELITKRLNELDVRIERLYGMKIDGLIDETKYKEKKNGLLMEEQQLKEAQSRKTTSYWESVIDNTINFATSVMELFDKGDIYTRQMVLRILGSNIILEDKKIKIEPKYAFIFLRDAENHLKGKIPSLEHIKDDHLTLKKSDYKNRSSTVLSLGVEPRSDALQAPAVTTLANSAR